jgi:hypothetical protein
MSLGEAYLFLYFPLFLTYLIRSYSGPVTKG